MILNLKDIKFKDIKCINNKYKNMNKCIKCSHNSKYGGYCYRHRSNYLLDENCNIIKSRYQSLPIYFNFRSNDGCVDKIK